MEVLVESPKIVACEAFMGCVSQKLLSIFGPLWTLSQAGISRSLRTKGTGSYEPLLSLIKPVVLVQSPKKAACEASMGYASEELLSIFLAPFGMFPKLCKFGFSGASCQKSHVKFPDVVM